MNGLQFSRAVIKKALSLIEDENRWLPGDPNVDDGERVDAVRADGAACTPFDSAAFRLTAYGALERAYFLSCGHSASLGFTLVGSYLVTVLPTSEYFDLDKNGSGAGEHARVLEILKAASSTR